MNSVDVAKVEALIADVAATEIMPRFRKLAQGDIVMKGVDDPVTVADKAAERALSEGLRALVPGSAVVGEECCSDDPRILSCLAGEDAVWIIDPIDGTRNFIEGRREFGVMVAYVKSKKTVAAWIHDPNSGHTLAAEEGGGVWLQGRKMRLAAGGPQAPNLVILGSRLRGILSQEGLASVIAALPTLVVGSAAAFDYARLFSGDILFGNSLAPRASCLLYRMSKPWDHVPGLFLQAEAHGYSADLFGNPYDMQDGTKGLLLAPDLASWLKIHNTIKPILKDLELADS